MPDISLPDDECGFVYFLVSVKDCGRTYVGQTKNISRCLKEHNKGWGAMGIAEPQHRQYAVADAVLPCAAAQHCQRCSCGCSCPTFLREMMINGSLVPGGLIVRE